MEVIRIKFFIQKTYKAQTVIKGTPDVSFLGETGSTSV